ncbi:MAG TPA: DUF1294 domain-containing protein, partial [Trichocoleus sp.]
WKDERGFGFIQPEKESGRVFLHITAVKPSSRRPQVGDVVRYQLGLDKAGKVCALHASIEGLAAVTKHSTAVSQPRRRLQAVSVRLGLEALLLCALPIAGALLFALTAANPLPLVLYTVMSLATYLAYFEDKFRAQKGKWRISEKTLHLFELAGGWMGAFVAQRSIRHKNRKTSYQLVFWAIVAAHYAFWVAWLLEQESLQALLFRAVGVGFGV